MQLTQPTNIVVANDYGAIVKQAAYPGTQQTGNENISGSINAGVTYYKAGVEWQGEGTSFPGTPTTNQRYFRTDRGIQYYYDGTRWLSELKIILMSTSNLITTDNLSTNTNDVQQCKHPSFLYDIYLVSVETLSYVVTTHTSGAYWVLDFRKQDTAAAETSVATTNSWKTGRVTNTTYLDTISLGIQYSSSVNPQFVIGYTKTGAPGNLYFLTTSINYRLVG
ncbi:MAG: hypothetical protein H0X33_13175 [Taibaiella sp.]|nr:hypothetical protein [Taibaiella sp.]